MTLDIDIRRQAVELEFGLCDRKLLLAINNRVLVARSYERDRGESDSPPLHPLAIGASGLEVELSELRVWRDIYYLDDRGLPGKWEAPPLASGQVALVGDNPPVTIDSRHGEPAAIPHGAILGRVYRPFWMQAR